MHEVIRLPESSSYPFKKKKSSVDESARLCILMVAREFTESSKKKINYFLDDEKDYSSKHDKLPHIG